MPVNYFVFAFCHTYWIVIYITQRTLAINFTHCDAKDPLPYLASPGKIGERRKELMSPKITPQLRKDIIKEDRAGAGTGVASIGSGDVNLGISMGGGGHPRKNSI